MLNLDPLANRPRSFAFRGAGTLVGIVVLGLALTLASGCAEKNRKSGAESKAGAGTKTGTAAVSDTAAFQSATSQSDTTAMTSALQSFLQDYPSSRLRPAGYSRLTNLLEKKDPQQAASFLQDHLQSEKDPASRGRIYYSLYLHAKANDPAKETDILDQLAKDNTPDADVYNMVAWDLVEQGKYLDQAINLASIGAGKAPDSLSKGSVLDTEGWAQFAKGSYPDAVKTLEQAVAWSPEQDVKMHLAQAYDKAGQAQQARDLYAQLLVATEDPLMRSRVAALTRQLHGSVAEVFSKVDADRVAAARPAADFTLNDYDGKPIHFADFKGKVVLLDFWHPT